MGKTYDFSGYATKNNLRCGDGRTILKDAFKDQDGAKVPLVYQHSHDDIHNVIGHALLENREDGVYCYGFFNDSEDGQAAKERVQHGDITAMSIYANKLIQKGTAVVHGAIREVSLVLAGANPGALIDNVAIQHSDGSITDIDDEAVIYTGLEFAHSDMRKDDDDDEEDEKDLDEEEEDDTDDEDDEEDKKVKKDDELKHAEEGGETVGDVFNTLTDKQKNAVYQIIADITGGDDDNEDEVKHSEGGEDMKYNAFDSSLVHMDDEGATLTHDQMDTIISDAKKHGSLKDAFLEHAGEYGITDIEYLFPDARTITDTPDFIKREMGWVSIVMGGTHHTPFSRIKSVHADITEDEARARGYIKGKRKIEEVFTLLKRTTEPQTIYKKQKLDRDDVIDITDFNVVAWLKTEMRMMLDEEIARAVLIGDGRNASSDDKIKEDKIRPIWNDDDLYTIKVPVEYEANWTDEDKAKAAIKAVIKARKNYKGSGNPTAFMTEDLLTDMLLIEDGIGHALYESVEKLATKLRVAKIVTVPVMENLTRPGRTDEAHAEEESGRTYTLAAVIVNLNDYNVGADKGGAVSMFEDFDIDYNQQKYLIETRCSGALIKPFSAMAVEFVPKVVTGG